MFSFGSALRRSACGLQTPLHPRLLASPARWFAADSKKGGKGRDARKIVFKQPTQHVLSGHGAKDRPLPAVARTIAERERLKAAAAANKGPKGADAGLETDDEILGDLLRIAAVAKPAPKTRPRVPREEREELQQLADAELTRRILPFVEAPADAKANMRVVEERFDEDAVTSDSEPEPLEVPAGLAVDVKGFKTWGKRGGRGPRDELRRMPGAATAAALRAGRGAAPAPGTIVAGLPLLRVERPKGAAVAAPAAEGGGSSASIGPIIEPFSTGAGGDGGEDDGALAIPDPEDLRALGTDVTASFPLFEAPLSSESENDDEDGGGGDDASSDSSEEEVGVYESAQPLGVQRPSMTRRPEAYYVQGLGSAAAEADARLTEEASALLSKGGKGGAAAAPTSAQIAALLGNDEDSDYGGDPLDPRFDHDPRIHAEDFMRLRGGLPLDAEAESLLELAVDEESGRRISGPFGSDILGIPSSVIDEFARPFSAPGVDNAEPYPKAKTVREAAMTPDERLIDERRKALRKIIEEPLPVPNRPLWPLYSHIACMDQVTQVLAGGMAQSSRVMVVVGNGMGGAGFGIGKHLEPHMATKLALANAQRDMIHVSTHKGQLYHDLIGKKHQMYVIIRTHPAASEFAHAAPMIQDVFELMGVTHASAKIVGSRRRNPYMVMQALFDAFNHHTPPEQEAATRGLRMLWMGANRLNPRMAYPQQPTGPRYPSANQRLVVGRRRA